MDYDNTNRGAIFPNQKKETEKHPDMTGSLDVGGVEYYVSGWTKVSKKGQKFLSLSVKAQEQVAKQHTQPLRQAIDHSEGLEDDWDLPF